MWIEELVKKEDPSFSYAHFCQLNECTLAWSTLHIISHSEGDSTPFYLSLLLLISTLVALEDVQWGRSRQQEIKIFAVSRRTKEMDKTTQVVRNGSFRGEKFLQIFTLFKTWIQNQAWNPQPECSHGELQWDQTFWIRLPDIEADRKTENYSHKNFQAVLFP